MTRREFMAGLAAAAAGSAFGVEGFAVEPNSVTLTRHHVNLEGGSHGPKLRIVQITDLHLEEMNDHARRVAEAVNNVSADLMVITGDSINDARGLGPLVDFLDLLDSGPPKYAIYGNWERAARIEPTVLGAAYETRNGRLLVNESIVHEHEGVEVLITGLDDLIQGRPDYPRAMAGQVPSTNHLLLEHCPEFRDRFCATAPTPGLMLAGHTHGGQVNLFGWAPVLPVGSGRYVRGWYRDGWPRLYVSRGIGTVTIPVRFGSPPEIAVFNWRLAVDP